MESALLVDSSIWIDAIRKGRAHALSNVSMDLVATCPPVVQEVVQGFRDDAMATRIRSRLLAFPMLGSRSEISTYLHAAEIYRKGRKLGLTIRSSIDCLIAAIAIESNAYLWHADKDFDAIARYSELKIFDPSMLSK